MATFSPDGAYLDQWTAGLVHDGPGVGGQCAAEEGGAEVYRHAGEPAAKVIAGPMTGDYYTSISSL